MIQSQRILKASASSSLAARKPPSSVLKRCKVPIFCRGRLDWATLLKSVNLVRIVTNQTRTSTMLNRSSQTTMGMELVDREPQDHKADLTVATMELITEQTARA